MAQAIMTLPWSWNASEKAETTVAQPQRQSSTHCPCAPPIENKTAIHPPPGPSHASILLLTHLADTLHHRLREVHG
jgi:hypothetical protein